MTAAAHVSPEGQAFEGQLAVWDDTFLPELERLSSSLRANGAVSSMQLHHGGHRAKARPVGSDAVGPWADPAAGARELTVTEIDGVVERFADAARRVERAGFDGVEVHGAHGYLLAQFLDGGRNLRGDGFGGGFADRSRVLLDVLAAIRNATGPDFQLGVRLSPHRYGVVLDESLLLAAKIMDGGLVDYLDMSLWDAQEASPRPQDEGRTLTELFAALPRGATRLGVAGMITSGSAAQRCLDQGVDFVLIGTGGILHHDFAARVLADPSFASRPQPVSRDHLESEGLGQRFIDYLADTWDDFVL